jgi:gamma-glutamylcyclotransferase (GGCT)/AIG2-like uncharacterized protein YtfP
MPSPTSGISAPRWRYIGTAMTAMTAPMYAMFQLSGYPAMIDSSHPEAMDMSALKPVWGELYEVDIACLENLDKIEGVAHNVYERRMVELQQITPILLPTCRDVFYNIFQRKMAMCYFYRQSVAGAKNCGSFWGPS